MIAAVHHVGHFGRVPGIDWLVEGLCIIEHALHAAVVVLSAPNLASQEGIGLRGTPRKAWKKPAGCVSYDEDR